MAQQKFDFFIFGSTSELMQALVAENMDWFRSRVHRLIVTQRGAQCPALYRPFDPISIALDCAEPGPFGRQLAQIVSAHATRDRPMHVWPTYGKFNWNYAAKNPVFSFAEDGYQINLVSRLQILRAFKPYVANTQFHLLGSLFANFPYTGDYALSMWHINQLPRNSEYDDYQLSVYNIGGCKTRFWNHASMGGSHPFLHPSLPTQFLFDAAFQNNTRGVKTCYPSVPSRLACWLGRQGVRVL